MHIIFKNEILFLLEDIIHAVLIYKKENNKNM